MRLSTKGLKVLRELLNEPVDGLSGSDLCRITKTGPGTIYPMLVRFETEGWLQSKWEEVDPSEAGRPRKRLFTLTRLGERELRFAIAELSISHAGEAWAI